MPDADPPANPGSDVGPATLALGRALRELGGAIIGGAAIALGSRARATRDVDAVVKGESHPPETLLAALAPYGFSLRPGATLDFAREHQILLLTHDATGVTADVSFGWLPFEIGAVDRADLLEVEGERIPVASPEDLAVMKTFAGRPQDVADVATLLQAHPGLDRAFVRSQVKELGGLLEDGGERLRLWDRLAKAHPRPKAP